MRCYRPTILVVEDDLAVAAVLVRALTRSEFIVSQAVSAQEALDKLCHGLPDLILLDIELPDRSGDAVLAALEACDAPAAVIVVTGCSDAETKESLFRSDIRDYVVKPFALHDLLLRIDLVLRAETRRATFCRAGLVLDGNCHAVRYGTKSTCLTPKLWQLLVFLVERAGQTVTWGELRSHVWRHAADTDSNTYRVHVGKLRSALEALDAPLCLDTLGATGVRVDVRPRNTL